MTPYLVDDPVGGLGVQMGGGFFGLICVALFKDDGVILKPSPSSAQVRLKIIASKKWVNIC